MAAKTVALFLMAAAVVDAKALDGTKTHASKPKKDKAAPAAAAPSADGGAPPATAAKSSKKSSPFTFTASMADDQKKVFKETLKKMSEARKISDTEQRKTTSQALDKSLHTLLGNDVYKTYRAESAARHSEAAAKHKADGTAASGTPSAQQASAPSQSALPTAAGAAPKVHKEHKKKSSSSSQASAPAPAPAAAGDGADSKPPKAKKLKTKKPSGSTSAA